MAKINVLKKIDLSSTLKIMGVGDYVEMSVKDMTQTAAATTCSRMKEVGMVFSVQNISDNNMEYRISRVE